MHQHHGGSVRVTEQLPQDPLDLGGGEGRRMGDHSASWAATEVHAAVARSSGVRGAAQARGRASQADRSSNTKAPPRQHQGGTLLLSCSSMWLDRGPALSALVAALPVRGAAHVGGSLEEDEIRVGRHVKAHAVLHVVGRHRRHRRLGGETQWDRRRWASTTAHLGIPTVKALLSGPAGGPEE